MTFVGSYTIDPKDYPFQKFIDEQKELDTDDLRHTIKPMIHLIDQDFKGEEHKFCDKEQLCPLGKYKRSKVTVEAEKRGFTSGLEMMEADKKAEEDAKKKETEDLRAYKSLSEERFEKMGRLIADQNKMMEFLMAKLK
jgi:hypothetical protein